MSFIDVMALAHLPMGGQHAMTIGGRRLLLCHTDSGVYAIENKCPHVGMPLCGGKLEGDVIRCPSHNATFDVRDGKPTRARTLGPVPTFPVRIEAGRIQVDIEP